MANVESNKVSRPKDRASRHPKGKESNKFRKTKKRIQVFFEEENEEFSDDDLSSLKETPADEPSYPYAMVIIAATKDLLDFLDFSLIGIIITTFFSLILALILFIWTHNKLSGGWWKRKMIGWIWIRYIGVIVIEFLPFFKLVPANTIFVIMAHNKETKIVKLLNEALEQMHSANMMRYIK